MSMSVALAPTGSLYWPDVAPVYVSRVIRLLIVVIAVDVLGVVGSAVAAEAVAVLDRLAVWDGLTVTTIVMSGAVVTARLARVQVTVVVPVQVQPVPLADTRVVFRGSGSETETELATDGPALLTDRV